MMNKLKVGATNGGYTKLILNGNELKDVIKYTLEESENDAPKITITLEVELEN